MGVHSDVLLFLRPSAIEGRRPTQYVLPRRAGRGGPAGDERGDDGVRPMPLRNGPGGDAGPTRPERRRQAASEIGRAHVCTPVTNEHLVCRLPLERQNTTTPDT